MPFPQIDNSEDEALKEELIQQREERNVDLTARNSSHQRLLVTVALVFLWIVLGLTSSVSSTANVDFSETLNETYGRLGMVNSLQTSCVMVGLFFGGIFTDTLRWTHETVLAIASILLGLSTIMKPHSPNLAVLAILLAAEGVIKGILEPVANNLLLGLWKEKVPVPVTIFHFGYGVGAIVGPFLAKPFLSQRCPATILNTTDREMCICQQTSGIDGIKYVRESRIVIPFTIAGTAMITAGILLLYLYSKSKDTPVDTSPKHKSDINGDEKKLWKLTMIALLVCFYFAMVDSGVWDQLFTIAFESDLGFNKDEASGVTSTFFASFTVGRAVCAFILQYISVQTVFVFYVFCTFASTAGFTFFGLTSKTSLWLYSAINALYLGSLWPLGYSWANQYIYLSSFAIATITAGACAGGIISNWLFGHLIDDGHIPAILIICFSFSGVMCLVTMALYAVGRKIRRKKI